MMVALLFLLAVGPSKYWTPDGIAVLRQGSFKGDGVIEFFPAWKGLSDYLVHSIYISSKPKRGKLVVLAFKSRKEVVDGRVFWNRLSFPVNFVGSSGGFYLYQSLIGIPLGSKTGKLKIFLSFRDGEEFVLKRTFRFPLKKRGKIRRVKLKLKGRKRRVYSRKDLGVKLYRASVKLWKMAKNNIETKRGFMGWSGFVKPVKGIITSGFGQVRTLGGNISVHKGIDIKAKIGTPVVAPADGKVVASGRFFGLGNAVVIHHGSRVFSVFLHLSKIIKKAGRYVRKGEVIGLVGNTGLSTAPHLHWGVRVGRVYVNPVDFLNKNLSWRHIVLSGELIYRIN